MFLQIDRFYPMIVFTPPLYTPRNEMDPTRDLNQNSLRTAVPRNKGIKTNFFYAAQQNEPRASAAALCV